MKKILLPFLFLSIFTFWVGKAVWAETPVGILRTPGDSAATAYAPVEVLDAQMKLIISELETYIKSEKMEDWEKGGAEIRRLASTIAAFAQVLGLHDQYSDFKMSASSIIEATNQLVLAKSAKEALVAWEVLQKALKSGESTLLSWETQVAKTRSLMQAIAVYDAEIQDRLKKLRKLDSVAGYAIAEAAIFQALTANSPEPGVSERSTEWKEFCMQARDAGYFLYITLDVMDRKHSPTNYEVLKEKCTQCHEKFCKPVMP